MSGIQRDWTDHQANPYIDKQLQYQTDQEELLAEQSLPKLNNEQRQAFDRIYTSTSTKKGKTFFLHGPGGMGKTFLYTTICHYVHGNGWFTLCVASSGIAALLLPRGHITHSTFSIPIKTLSEDSSCQVEQEFETGRHAPRGSTNNLG